MQAGGKGNVIFRKPKEPTRFVHSN